MATSIKTHLELRTSDCVQVEAAKEGMIRSAISNIQSDSGVVLETGKTWPHSIPPFLHSTVSKYVWCKRCLLAK